MIDSIDSPYIHAGYAENFTSLVLDNSTKGPVLVYFWSKNAAPCLRQYPVLDKLIHAYGGRILLVNIDADHEIKIKREYSVTSVPTLKVFRHLEVVETLHGYQSERDLKHLLDRYVARDSDQQLSKALQLYTQGQQTEAYDTITQAIIGDPDNLRLPVALCKLLNHEERYYEAIKLLESLPLEAQKDPEIVQLKDYLSFVPLAEKVEDVDSVVNILHSAPNDLNTREQLAAYYVISRNYELALAELQNILEIDQKHNNEYARKSMLKIFNLVGNNNKLVKQYRAVLIKLAH